MSIATLIVGLLLGVGALKYVRDAYPADPFKSEALRHCLAHDPAFIRFSADDRANCYARQPQMAGYQYSPN
ncbi:MAG TPA: hypothetical protein VFW46_13495 [Stellaceae bacterium]|nr:hypothetical protein [Stellaceae bacterium]